MERKNELDVVRCCDNCEYAREVNSINSFAIRCEKIDYYKWRTEVCGHYKSYNGKERLKSTYEEELLDDLKKYYRSVEED